MKKIWIALCCLLLVCGCTNTKAPTEEDKVKDDVVEEQQPDEVYKASFLAVGDNLIHGAIYQYAQTADGYDFTDIYENTNKMTQKADLAYINFETICAGTDLELSSYPTFNGPFQVIDGVHSAGFDWLSGASNHTFDRGEEGILRELKYTRKHFDDMTITGIHNSEEDAAKTTVFDVNGMKVGVLDYTYGLNGFAVPEGKEYLVDLIDKDKIKADYEKLAKVSDIQMISMHWGEEYQFEPNEEQKDLAQYCCDLGVDVIIGCHPHVIQPMTYLKSEDGHKMLCMYSLGNFLSAQDVNYRMLGGMATWNIEYNKTKDTVKFKNVKFYPTITQIGRYFQYFRTYLLKDWTDEMGREHTLANYEYQQEMTREYFINLATEVVSDKRIKVVYE